MRRDKNSGRFLPVKRGTKTQRMLEVEEKIGQSLEKDFKEQHLLGELGQKRLANRWSVPRGLIFGGTKRRGWVDILGLPRKRKTPKQRVLKVPIKKLCEICGQEAPRLINAHWIPSNKGGPGSFFNILKVCPNCHDRLDMNDSIATKRAKETLLVKAAKAILERKVPK